jgi:hypothetical protein
MSTSEPVYGCGCSTWLLLLVIAALVLMAL